MPIGPPGPDVPEPLLQCCDGVRIVGPDLPEKPEPGG